MSVTVILIVITVLVSLVAFSSVKLRDELIFYPVLINSDNQYYRFITYGFIHADLPHLLFNMYALYLFGNVCENSFVSVFGRFGTTLYVLMYLLSLIACVIPDFLKYKGNPNYRSLGASGAVSAVVFAYILFRPLQGIGLLFIPVFIPGFLFGILFLIISYFLGKKGGTAVNHAAHIWGALFGVFFLIICSSLFSDYPLLENFMRSVRSLDVRHIFSTY